MGQANSNLFNRSRTRQPKPQQIYMHVSNAMYIVKKYKNIKFITFDVDEWTVNDVCVWINSFDVYDILEKVGSVYGDKPPVHELKQNISNIIIANNINGLKFRTFSHNNDTEDWHKRFDMAVIFYTQKLKLTELFISAKKPDNLYINTDTMLLDSKTYIFNDIYIQNCTLTVCNIGILVLISLNNIIIDNAKINMNGKGYDNNAFELKTSYAFCADYGHDVNQIFVGSRGSMGDSCSGGGRGGNGLILQCKNALIIVNKSCISSKGSLFIHNCWYGCGPAGGGGILIKCYKFYQDGSSGINSLRRYYDGARVVLKIGYLDAMKGCLIQGFMRRHSPNKVVVNVLRDIIDGFTVWDMDLESFYENMSIHPKPIIVDGKWNVLNADNAEIPKAYNAPGLPHDADIPADGFQVRHPDALNIYEI